MPQIPPTIRPQPKKLRVGFLLAEQFTLSAFANFVDVLRLAADEADRSRPIHCEWVVMSSDLNAVGSSCGVSIQPHARLGHAGSFDYIVVVGGLIQDHSALPQDALVYLQIAAAAGVPLIGLCTGVFLLHEAGLMDGYRCCVSWFHHDDFLERFAGIKPVSDQIFVIDRDRLTCSGGHSAAHLAAFLVERHIGHVAATKSLSIMMIDEAMGGERPQPGFPISLSAHDPLVRKALIRMRQTMAAPETVDVLAKGLGTSRRQIERKFQSDLGASPSRVSMRLRLDEACRRLTGTKQTVTHIAVETGFCDASHFTKSFKAEIGQTPSEFRQLMPLD
jgi:transcriptional regulator GlxA family with amidase domain